MSCELTEDTEFISYLWTREEYEQYLKGEQVLLERSFRKARNKRLLIRLSAWLSLIVCFISIVILNNTFLAIVTWLITATLIMTLKFGKHL